MTLFWIVIVRVFLHSAIAFDCDRHRKCAALKDKLFLATIGIRVEILMTIAATHKVLPHFVERCPHHQARPPITKGAFGPSSYWCPDHDGRRSRRRDPRLCEPSALRSDAQNAAAFCRTMSSSPGQTTNKKRGLWPLFFLVPRP